MSLEANQVYVSKLVHEAIDLGINYFDTADIYQAGINEEMVGKALSSHRNKVILATKVGNQIREDGSGLDWNPRKEYIVEAVEKSLRRLGTDYIDLYQLHGGTIEDPIDETIEAFETLKQQGKIRYYGISSIRPNVIREYIKKSSIVTVMMQYSLLDRRPEEECLSLLSEANISVLVRGALAGGLLVDNPAKDYLGYSINDIERYKNYLTATGLDSTDLSIQFVLHRAPIASAIIGIRTTDQLKAAIKAENSYLSENQQLEISNQLKPLFYTQHR